ncbi:hypothetical protein IFR05_005736 [Cadophora sp. M221]|nr:hypothetical protein IFR05_005736 [Cadophora sp. M221]
MGACQLAKEGPRAKQKMNDADPIEEQNSCFALFEKQTSFVADSWPNPHSEVSRIPDFLIRNPRQTRHKMSSVDRLEYWALSKVTYLFTPSSVIRALPWPQVFGLTILFCSVYGMSATREQRGNG